MQYLANEFLEKNYKNVLKIYTDGSVMDDGAAGAAFVDPEFNNMTHSFSLHAVSIYTAELVAILMDLQHLNETHTPLSAIVTVVTPELSSPPSGPTLLMHRRIWYDRS